MSAPVTEAHRKLVAAIIRDLSIDDGAQLIADSEAKAVEQANAQVESLLSAAKNAIPASEHPAEPTVENWAWQMRNLGEDRRLVYADRDKLRAEVEHLRESEKAFCEDRNTQRARAERAEASLHALRLVCGTTDADKFTTWVDRAIARAERAEAEIKDRAAMMRDVMRERDAAEAELAAERAIVSRIWVQLGSPTYAQLKGRSIYCLIDEMKAELASERARLDWLEDHGWVTGEPCDRAGIDAAMKEGA